MHPGERSRIPARRRAIAYVLAVLAPLAVAAVMIPFREDHDRVAVLVLVIPVLLVALLGAIGPAIVAAVCAVLAYDFFLAQPYYSLAIDDTDDVVAAITLLIVAVAVGVLSGRLVRLRVQETTRRDELRLLVGFIHASSERRDSTDLGEIACGDITAVLNLTSCVWQPGKSVATGPVLLADGSLMGPLSELNSDRAVLPNRLELPVWRDGVQLGRFEVTSAPHNVVSYEERAVAAAIAQLYGQVVDRSAPA